VQWVTFGMKKYPECTFEMSQSMGVRNARSNVHSKRVETVTVLTMERR
jgi:hypothetical protein